MALEFHFHDDLINDDRWAMSQNAWLVFFRCGNYTARNAADGIVPPEVPCEVDFTPLEAKVDPEPAIAELIELGLWSPGAGGGWRMNYGPTDEWDGPLPLWRYSAPQDGIEVTPGYTIFPEPDA